MFKFYEVGGCVRDELMGLKSKDIDYTVVADKELLDRTHNPDEIFHVLEDYLKKQGYTIWLSTPDCFTIRAKFPTDHKNAGITADFVLARKEVGYISGTRKPRVVPGTLEDDLRRRDFTINAIAKDEDGKYIDLFNGIYHIEYGLLITPLDVIETLNDDPLRILRAIRFAITKGFFISSPLCNAIKHYDYENRMKVVSQERIQDELTKCFKYDTFMTLELLKGYPALFTYILKKTSIWLKPTNESR